VVECQLSVARDKRYSWVEYLAAARRTFATDALVFVISPVDRVITWAHGLFARSPGLRPILIGARQVPMITDPRRALRKPELAVLSAVFHGDSERGSEVLFAAATAMRSMSAAARRECRMLLEDALPEARMDEIRQLTDDEAQHAADEWLRSRGPYQIGHREGLEQGLERGLEQGLEQGLERGLHQALALVLELRGLVPTPVEQARIDACRDPVVIERWCQRAKTAGEVDELFDD
jgi:hypothetical protein